LSGEQYRGHCDPGPVEGANINFSEDAQFHSVLDAVLIRHLSAGLAATQGLGQLNCIGGSAAGFMAEEP
jgi:2,4'-dihydroxyacetophenone dioxygenase